MTRSVCRLAPYAIFGLFVAGCAAPGVRPGHGRYDTSSLAAHRSTALVTRQARPLRIGQRITTDQVLRFGLRHGPWLRWKLTVAPNPAGRSATFKIDNSVPVIFVFEGWVHVDTEGNWAWARTDRLIATATGTRFIVQREGPIHRVVMLSGTSVTVELAGDANVRRILTRGNSYVEFSEKTGVLTSPADVQPPPDPVGQLVENVVQTVRMMEGP